MTFFLLYWLCVTLERLQWKTSPLQWIFKLLKDFLGLFLLSGQWAYYSTRGHCCQTFAFLMLLSQKFDQKSWKKLHFRCMTSISSEIIFIAWSIIITLHTVWFAGQLQSHWTLHPSSHYGATLWTVSLCTLSMWGLCVCVFPPWKQKALQWQRELQCSATIHPELQTVWVPTHSCSSHTLLLLQITRGRERGGKARDQAGPGRDAGNLNEASHPFDSLSEAGRECVDCK